MALPERSCNDMENLLDAYFDDELTSHERSAVEEHLAACQECTSKLTAIGRVSASLQALPRLEMTRDITQTVKLPTVRPNVVPMRPLLWAAMGSAAVAVVVVLIGTWQFTAPAPVATERPLESNANLDSTSTGSIARTTEPVGEQVAGGGDEPALPVASSDLPSISGARSAGTSSTVEAHPTYERYVLKNGSPANPKTLVATGEQPAAAIRRTADEPSGWEIDTIGVAFVPEWTALTELLGIATDEDGLYEIQL